jgi:AcrR family transcriptional regulator
MAHSGPKANAGYPGERGLHPSHVARACRRFGTALVGAALPALAATMAVALMRGIDSGAFEWVTAAMGTHLVGGAGLQWAWHVAAVTGLAGVWAFGFALVVEGLFGLD